VSCVCASVRSFFFFFFFGHIIQLTPQKLSAERKNGAGAEAPASGQAIRRGIEGGENPAAAGIEFFCFFCVCNLSALKDYNLSMKIIIFLLSHDTQGLALSLYKTFFYLEAFVHESIVRLLPPPPALPTLSQFHVTTIVRNPTTP